MYHTIKFSCTGGVSYALFILLLISKLFCRKGWVGVWVCKIRLRYIINIIRTCSPPLIQLGEGGPLAAIGTETHVHKITNVLVFFIWRLDWTILMRANPLNCVFDRDLNFKTHIKSLMTKISKGIFALRTAKIFWIRNLLNCYITPLFIVT